MTEPTDRLKIRESGHLGKNTSIHTDNNISGFEFYKDETLEYQHALMKSHIGFAQFHLHHSTQIRPLSDQQIYAMWQEKSREK